MAASVDYIEGIVEDLDGLLAEFGFIPAANGLEEVGEEGERLTSWFREGDDVEVVALFAADGVDVSVETVDDTLDSWVYAYAGNEASRIFRMVSGVMEERI